MQENEYTHTHTRTHKIVWFKLLEFDTAETDIGNIFFEIPS